MPRLVVSGPATSPPSDIAKKILAALEMRRKYLRFAQETVVPSCERSNAVTACYGGIFAIDKSFVAFIPSWAAFLADTEALNSLSHQADAQNFALRRLLTLEQKFRLHCSLLGTDHTGNSTKERSDLYRCTKVDVHCHAASGPTAKELLLFIQEKVTKFPSDVVGVNPMTRQPKTIAEVFSDLRRSTFRGDLDMDDLSISSLDVQAGPSLFNRFDQFNSKYNPFGTSELRALFLKTDNDMGGRYFAELLHRTFRRIERQKTTFTEFRLSIYGRHKDEWNRLAKWLTSHGMAHPVNRWVIQVPRLYSVFKQSGDVCSFEEMLRNIFEPLWEVSSRPETNPLLSHILNDVSGFDSVDNESEMETDQVVHLPPSQWTAPHNPPFQYYMYYMWANITTLNLYRRAKGLSTFSFRPHCGESGDPDHMVCAFLLAESVGHGIALRKRNVMQYLFYLSRIGMGITPLSNNALFCKYEDNPFPTFFRRGLNVTLSTDGPLQFHHTQEPLVEEYSTALKYWQLSVVDACEIARNSVLISNFSSARKAQWLGPLFDLGSAVGNCPERSRVPDHRIAFRYEVFHEECDYLESRAGERIPGGRFMHEAPQEEFIAVERSGKTRDQLIQEKAMPMGRL
jgi:AMP deaminase